MSVDLNKEMAKVKSRMNKLAELMLDIKHPEFDKMVSERNSLSVQLEVLKQQHTGKWQPSFKCPIYKLPNI